MRIVHPFVVILAVSFLGPGGARDGSAQDDITEGLFPFYAHEAAGYAFALDAERQRKLELQSEPLLKWTNAERFAGSVFVWSADGRPEVIGCIGSEKLSGDRHRVFHEFHSLTVKPLPAASIGGGLRSWESSVPGVTLKPVPGAPAPAESEKLRAAQMRTLARGFSAWMKDGEDVSELRLLPQPLFRYRSPGQGVIDGAIFSYVWTKGTDPEVLLLVECRKTDSGLQWQSAPARFNWRELWLKHGEEELWRVGKTDEFWQAKVLKDCYVTGVIKDVGTETVRSAAEKVGGDQKPSRGD